MNQLELSLTIEEPTKPSPWDLLKAGLREDKMSFGDRVDYLREKVLEMENKK